MSVNRSILRGVCLVLAVCSLVPGCGERGGEAEQVVPRVKCFTVSDEAVGQQRSLSGKVIAGESSPLSFSVGGTVKQVMVERGDRVSKGQALALLDAEPLSLAVEQARGQLVAAREKVVETRRQRDNIKSLYDQGAATKLEFENAQTAFVTAEANLQSAQADLDRRQLDLKKTQLSAPTDGTIAERSVEAFQEVSAGQTIFVLEGMGAFKVEVMVPETLIRDLDYGQVVQVRFPTLNAEPISGTIQTISAQALAGNAYPVEIALPAQGLELRSGMTASVMFQFAEYLEGQTAYLIPLSAIAVEAEALLGRQPGPDEDGVKHAQVYVLNEEAGVVELRTVVIGGLRGNTLEVFEGLEPGDKVVSAGVAFVRDKMKAREWTADQGLSDG